MSTEQKPETELPKQYALILSEPQAMFVSMAVADMLEMLGGVHSHSGYLTANLAITLGSIKPSDLRELMDSIKTLTKTIVEE